MRKFISCLVIFIFSVTLARAQSFLDEVNAFSKQDSLDAPSKNAILLIGSSSFTYWKDVATYFPGRVFINRAFGGSSLTHQIEYIEKVVYPYQPKQILIYCGENDIAASQMVTADSVFNRFVRLHQLIRKKYPAVRISFVSIKPSPVRAEFLSTVIISNKLIADFCRKNKKTDFIDVFSSMLNTEGKPMEELFIADRLHMNAKGYAIWSKIIAPYLVN
jgi:lysophospholipase L1-like esterase